MPGRSSEEWIEIHSGQLDQYHHLHDYCLDNLMRALPSYFSEWRRAHFAYNRLNLSWFRDSKFSPVAKMTIAEGLIEQVARFKYGAPSLWTQLANGEPNILEDVAFFYTDDTTIGYQGWKQSSLDDEEEDHTKCQQLEMRLSAVTRQLISYEWAADSKLGDKLTEIDIDIHLSENIAMARQRYSLEWFRSQEFSCSAKSFIAKSLVKRAKVVNETPPTLWEQLSSSEYIYAEMVQFVFVSQNTLPRTSFPEIYSCIMPADVD